MYRCTLEYYVDFLKGETHHLCDKGCVSEYIKNSCNSKKVNSKNRQSIWVDISRKKTHMAYNAWKDIY